MARTAAVACWTQARAWTRAVRRCAGLATVVCLALSFSDAASAQAVKGTASMGTSGGYGRIVLKLAEDVESEVTQAGTILVIRFKRPVDILSLIHI